MIKLNIDDLIKVPVRRHESKKLDANKRAKDFDQVMVSVCIITYNHEKYIGECLDSVLSQKTSYDFRILLGEDNSSDQTRQICIEYAEKYPEKIQLYLHNDGNRIRVNGNKTGRFNNLYNLSQASGKYIAFCDGDDYWIDPLKLQKQVDFLESHHKCFMMTHKLPAAMDNVIPGWYDMKKLFKKLYLPHFSNYMLRNFDMNKYKKTLVNIIGGEMCLLYIAASEGLIYHSDYQVSEYRTNSHGLHTSQSVLEQQKSLGLQVKILKNHFSVSLLEYHRKQFRIKSELNKITGEFKFQLIAYKMLFSISKLIKPAMAKGRKIFSSN